MSKPFNLFFQCASTPPNRTSNDIIAHVHILTKHLTERHEYPEFYLRFRSIYEVPHHAPSFSVADSGPSTDLPLLSVESCAFWLSPPNEEG